MRTLPTWLDRLWLGLIAVAFVFFSIIFTLVWAERVGWRVMLIWVGSLFLMGFLRSLLNRARR